MDTIIWIFHNIMPWIGAWFAAMTVIFLLVATYCTCKKREFRYVHMMTAPAYENTSIIVSFIPMVLFAFIALIINGISQTPSLVRKIGNKISNISFVAK